MRTKVFVEELRLPTYAVGREDIDPPYFEKNVYPYPKNDFLTSDIESVKYKAVILENEYLRISILPELGGRVFSVFDKTSGKEVFYRNNVVKPALLGLRGGWISGGVEFNFLTNGTAGHTVSTISPVDYLVKENVGGSATVLIGEMEQVSRMKWVVAITLCPGERLFEVGVKIFNRVFLPNRYYFWTNVSIPATENTRYIYPMNRAHYYFYSMYRIWYRQDKYTGPYPILNDLDLSWQKNHVDSNDIFGLKVDEDFFGYYDYKNSVGAIHVADHNIVQGRKIWNWGNSDNAVFFSSKVLTDKDGHYAEIQSGRFETQGIFGVMDPLVHEDWKEYWYPVSNTNGFVYANKLAAINIQKSRRSDKIALGISLSVTKEVKDATLQVSVGNSPVFEDKISISPERIYQKSLTIERDEAAKVNLVSSAGEKLLTYTERRVDERLELTKLPDKRKLLLAPQDFLLEGSRLERYGEVVNAKKMYERAIELDREFVDGHLSLGKILLQMGLYDDAEKCFSKVLELDDHNEEAFVYLGLSLRETERFRESEEALWKLFNSQKCSPLASYLLGEIRMNEREYGNAERSLRSSLKYNASNIRALNGLSCCLRKQGKYEEATEVLDVVLGLDPLNCFALYEVYKNRVSAKEEEEARGTLEKFRKMIDRTIHNCLETAIEYIRLGVLEDAIDILKLALESENGHRTLLLYYLAYCCLKHGDIEEAKEYASSAEKSGLDYCFPNKLEEEKMLREIVGSNIGGGKAHYCLGNILFSKHRYDEALLLWEKAIELGVKYSVLHRNIGLALWKIKGNLGAAAKEYRAALELNKNDYRLYLELDELCQTLGLHEERVERLESAPPSVLRNGNVLAKLASAYFDIGRAEKALEILMENIFPSREFGVIDLSIWDLYHDACIELGLSKLRESKNGEALEYFRQATKYPHNLGTGEPHRRLNAAALYYQGIVYEKIGGLDEAERSWRDASAEEHEWWSELRYYRALSLQRLGKHSEAERIFDDMIRMADQNLRYEEFAYWHFIRGLALKGKGRHSDSVEELEKALSMDPANRKCRRELRETKELQV